MAACVRDQSSGYRRLHGRAGHRGARRSPATRSQKDAPLVTLESDKATMEVPSTLAGEVKEIKVKVGDKVSRGLGADQRRDRRRRSRAGARTRSCAGTGGSAAGRSTSAPAPAPAPAAAATATVTELIVPDIGGFNDVPVIERLHQSRRHDRQRRAARRTGEPKKRRWKCRQRVARAHPRREGPRRRQGLARRRARARRGRRRTGRRPRRPRRPPRRHRLPQRRAPAAAARANGHAAAGVVVHASPAIRRFARELGVTLARSRAAGPTAASRATTCRASSSAR